MPPPAPPLPVARAAAARGAPPPLYPPVAFHFRVSFGTATRDADCSFREVSGIAELMGATSSQVALSWVRQQQTAVPVIPIIGARTKAQLESNLDSL